MQACDRCHRRKSRCDKQVPVCGPCRKANVACVYTDRSKEPTYRKEVVERLERRLRQCEATNRALAARLAAAQSESSNAGNGSEVPASRQSPSLDASSSSPGQQQQQQQQGQRIQQQQQQQQPKQEGDNEVTDEVSFLSLTAGGDRQFLGSGSGVLFANLVRATVDAAPVPISTPARTAFTPRASHSENPARGGSIGSAFSIGSPAAKSETYQIPPEPFARDLHHAYFEHDYLCYPFLHRPTVLTAFEQIYRDPSVLDRDVFSCFIFYMILAISSVDYHKFDWQTRPDAENFHVVALSKLTEVLQLGGIKPLQAILLLCQYRMRSPIQDTSASMWHLVGVACRICIEQGLHRESTYPSRTPSDRMETDSPSNTVRAEVGRRCFFCVIAMDRVVSNTLGRPFGIRLSDTDTALPDPQYDLEVNPPESSFHPTTDCFSRTALFVHIVRYRIICGKILFSMDSGQSGSQESNEASALSKRDNLAAELEQWRHDTASLSLPAVDLSSTIPGDRSSFRAHEWYELLYYNALLMLYRPSPALPAVSSTVPTAIQTIFTAAKQSITLYAHLHRSRRINYTWITLHAVFMAGLSYIYAVGRHFRAKRRLAMGGPAGVMLDEDPSIIEIVNETRACSTVLVAVSERWSAIRHSHEVFHRLSDAVLSDAIELLNNPPQSTATAASGTQSLVSPMKMGPMASPTSLPTSHLSPMANAGMDQWPIPDTSMSPQLAVDSVLRDCFRDLQHMNEYSYGDDPICRLSQDWLGEIGGMALDAVHVWGE
ncbi:hypothetical protein MGYG_09192 [Nannizzia gypsea CBS 118893]|uniref:Zn(2)-C6 fungal-type domain-containing protein n=1 Tax=Arthroderma gypseum (strain ATCC MYA-4604 / CBS 118893) TaxID=535722 RepID=E4V641_ARTGP|nr:hypothetical protein MGYG_09192 [Nannizzia gypsea CBS 118893]EFR05224.1 hypothetical protein MGYG_09192 [Nannizzia gypsea CBS 118893]